MANIYKYAAAMMPRKKEEPPVPEILQPLRFTNKADEEVFITFEPTTYMGDFFTDVFFRINGEGDWLDYVDYGSIIVPIGGFTEVIGYNKDFTPPSTNGIGTFLITDPIEASGNVMSLLYGNELNEDNMLIIPHDNMFASLFKDSTGLLTAPLLPATSLTSRCYYDMFWKCSSLEIAPVLPATELADHCYSAMFYKCTSLKASPALPATTLAPSCYSSMYYGCSSLTSTGYLGAENLVDKCYYRMYYGCSSIKMIKTNFIEWLDGATKEWVAGVAMYGMFYYRDGLNLGFVGMNGIPEGWDTISVRP